MRVKRSPPAPPEWLRSRERAGGVRETRLTAREKLPAGREETEEIRKEIS